MRQSIKRYLGFLKRLKNWPWISIFAVVLGSAAIWCIYKTQFLAGFWGLRDDEIAIVTIEEGKEDSPETVTVVAPNKSIWDAAELLGVPLALAVFGAWFQKIQQKQSEQLLEKQREQDADNTREEVLQLYFDRISTLLIDKNLMAIADKLNDAFSPIDKRTIVALGRKDDVYSQQKELLEVSVSVIRARTLSILRRFERDSRRKSSVIRFLTETEVVDRLKISLAGADLSGTKLFKVNLSEIDLSNSDFNKASLIGANLEKANLNSANLSKTLALGINLSGASLKLAKLNEANLMGADLSRTYLRKTQLRGADLSHVDLSKARFSSTNLSEANLYRARLFEVNLDRAIGLTQEQVSQALLCGTRLPKTIDLDPDRDCGMF